ncbi:hypothetical protein C8R43DRAFT_885075 [Mycena crocata]|nr:hypothetical protein C8R43DRAFT_885075 [Mycena crocata]
MTVTAAQAFPWTDALTDAYIRQQTGIPKARPVSLWSLVDPKDGDRPAIALHLLVKVAICGSQSRRLTLKEIQRALMNRFEYFGGRANDASWMTSLRHVLSNYDAFRNSKEANERVSYWRVDFSGGDGRRCLPVR